MRVALSGGGPMDTAWAEQLVAPALQAAGHKVVAVATAARSRWTTSDDDALVESLQGCDALVSLSSALPLRRPQRLVAAARAAGVRRVVQQSVSLMYADQGEDWITERSPLCVTPLTEAASMAEVAVQQFASPCREGVVLRMGMALGTSSDSSPSGSSCSSPSARWWLRAMRGGRSGADSQDAGEGFAHVIHRDDVGPAVRAALEVPSGIYNVGAAPVRRAALFDQCLAALGRRGVGEGLRSRPLRRSGHRLEPMHRSLRVSSSTFMGVSGWAPRHESLDSSWFGPVGAGQLALR